PMRFCVSALVLAILLRLGVRAAGVPIRLLVNIIAGVDMYVGAFRLVGRLKLDTRVTSDLPRFVAVTTVSGAVVAGRNLEHDSVGRESCFRHAIVPSVGCALCVPI